MDNSIFACHCTLFLTHRRESKSCTTNTTVPSGMWNLAQDIAGNNHAGHVCSARASINPALSFLAVTRYRNSIGAGRSVRGTMTKHQQSLIMADSLPRTNGCRFFAKANVQMPVYTSSFVTLTKNLSTERHEVNSKAQRQNI